MMGKELTGRDQLAVIMQGIAARSAKGQASSAQARAVGSLFPLMGYLAVDTIERAERSRSKVGYKL